MELLLCIGLFVGKVIEIVLFTLRTIMATRNKKGTVAFLGFVNNAIGIVNLATVAVSITTSPFRVAAYALGETVGTYIGMIMDKKLALGSNVLTIVIDKPVMNDVVDELSKNDFKVTYMIGKGLKEDRAVLKVFTERKREPIIKNILKENNIKAVIFESKILNMSN